MIGQKETYYRFILGYRSRKFFLFFALMVTTFLQACSNSQDIAEGSSFIFDMDSVDDPVFPLADEEQLVNDTVQKISPIAYLPLDDTEYPYAGIPRIVIETEDFKQIKDRETEIPAKLQIWGEKAPESEILDLTIRGRGNSSWLMMPKKSYKIKFNSKYSPLGMPANKDWNFVSNYADKSLLKNTLSYRLSELLEMDYSPKNKFFEFYLNREYLGVYLLTETVEFAHKRINEPLGTYLVEFDNHSQSKDQTITTNKGISFTIHYPKKATNLELAILKNHLDSLETIFSNNSISDSTIYKNFDIDAYIKYYWVQEFSKNKDGAFLSSVYFTWSPGGTIKMGPLWDFDGAYGVNTYYNAKDPSGWLIRNHYWNTALFQNKSFTKQVKQFWDDNNILFHSLLDLVKCYEDSIYASTKNNFKRWPILGQTSDVLHQYPFSTYDEVVDTLKTWIDNRLEWIDNHL